MRRLLTALAIATTASFTPSAEAATLGQLRAKVRTHYAKSLKCPRRDVAAAEIPGSRRAGASGAAWDFHVEACGRRFVVAATELFGLRGFDDLPVYRQAPGALACPADQVTVTWIDPRTRVVEGCGKRATWRYSGKLLETGAWGVAP